MKNSYGKFRHHKLNNRSFSNSENGQIGNCKRMRDK